MGKSASAVRAAVLVLAAMVGGCPSGPQEPPPQHASAYPYGPSAYMQTPPEADTEAPGDEEFDAPTSLRGMGGGGAYSAATLPPDPAKLGELQDRFADFVFDGGQLDFEMYRSGTQIVQLARNRYISPVVIKWTITPTTNVRGRSELQGSTTLPPASRPGGLGAWVRLATLEQIDPASGYQRAFSFRGRFGDPDARPTEYAYRLPFPTGSTFPVLQGFHGKFSHRGSNEFAVDFDCPVATTVLAAREGTVIASNGTAVGAGSTPEYLDYKKVNFVLIRHADGTLGEYMHLAPSGVLVKPGDHVTRGQPIARSGNTGFSSTPHLHFQLMTAGRDGISARSFPFAFAISKDSIEQPVLGHRYTAWE